MRDSYRFLTQQERRRGHHNRCSPASHQHFGGISRWEPWGADPAVNSTATLLQSGARLKRRERVHCDGVRRAVRPYRCLSQYEVTFHALADV